MFFFGHRSQFSKAEEALYEGNYTEAEQLFSEILEKDPKAFEVWLHRALTRVRLGRLEEAKTDVLKATEIQPENGVTWMVYGEVLQAASEFNEARAAFLQAIRFEKDNGRAYLGLAKAELALGHKAEAAESLEMSLQFERDYSLANCFTELLSSPKS